MLDEHKNSSGLMWGIGVLFLAVVAYGTFNYVKKDSNSEIVSPTPIVTNPTPTPISTSTPTSTSTITVSSEIYKNGNYTSEGSYLTPGGIEKISVTLTIKDNVITAANVISLGIRSTTKKMQAKFISGYKAEVIGKKLSDVTLSKVSGSSLTPKGWNDAIAKIQISAKA